MNFISSRERGDFSILTAAILLLVFVSAAFGTINSTANQQGQEYKSSLQNRQIKRTIGRGEAARFGFRAKNSSALFSAQAQPLLEYLTAGDLDMTFGSGGKVTTQIGNSESEAVAVALQTDGKFVAAGYSFNTANADFALARYNANGSLDTTFGSGGKVTTDFGGGDNFILALAIQPSDGKFVAAGYSSNNADDHFALARYNSDGTLDGTFGSGGIVTTNFGNSSDYIDGIAIQTDGKIVAAGYRLVGSYFHFALARYNSDGTLDGTFGSGGMVTTNLTDFDDLARAVVLQPDGKIVAAGEANADFTVVRYNTDGSLDTSFDGDGKVITSISVFDSAYDVALQPDGKIVTAGETGDGTNSDFALVRYNSNGSLDTSFDGDGIVRTAIGASDEFASSLALQANGKIIAGGFSFNGRNDDFALVGYNSDGSLDSSFGAGGKITTDFSGSSYDYISDLAIQSSGRVIAVGSSNSNFAAAAYSLNTSNCSYSLSPTTANFVAGGTGTFNINTTAGCSYTAVSNASYITITNGSSGSGSGTITFSVESNPGATRTGTITVGGQTFTVNQATTGARRKKLLLSPPTASANN